MEQATTMKSCIKDRYYCIAQINQNAVKSKQELLQGLEGKIGSS